MSQVEEARLLGRWKVVELVGRWILEEKPDKKGKAKLPPMTSSTSGKGDNALPTSSTSKDINITNNINNNNNSHDRQSQNGGGANDDNGQNDGAGQRTGQPGRHRFRARLVARSVPLDRSGLTSASDDSDDGDNEIASAPGESDDNFRDQIERQLAATEWAASFGSSSSSSSSEDSNEDDDDVDDEDKGGSDSDDSDGELERAKQASRQQQQQEEQEEIGALLELNLLEMFLTCKEEGSAEWRMVNQTERLFINPFASVKEYAVDENGELLFVDEKGHESQKLEASFDPQGRLSLLRENGSIITLQKILEAQTPFTLGGLFQGDRPFSDVKIRSLDKKDIPCHAVILRARCPELLEHTGRELMAASDSKVIQGLLHFIYTDTIPENVSEILKPLQALGKQLRLERLAMLCEESIQNHAVKNELIQLIGDLSDAVKRIQTAAMQDFLVDPVALTAFLTLTNTESTVMSLKIWLICYLYGKRKDEMTKTEQRELREYSRMKAIDITKQLNDIYTLVTHQFQQIGAERLPSLVDDLRPFAEDPWEFAAKLSRDLTAFISMASQGRQGGKENAFKKILGKQSGFGMRKLKKNTLQSMAWVVHTREKYQQRTETLKKEIFREYTSSFLQDLFMNPDINEEVRNNKVNKLIQNVYNQHTWKLIVKEATTKVVWLMNEAERYQPQVAPIVAKVVERYADPNLVAIFQRLGYLQPDQPNIPRPDDVVATKPVVGTLNMDFKRFMKSPELSDMFFVVEGVRVPAHRVIVASNSAHFHHSLQSGMREATEREINLLDVSMECFDLLLEFFYGGVDLESADVNVVIELMKICDEYQVSSLKQMCGELLRTHVDVENAVALFEIADRSQEANLKAAVLEFIGENSEVQGTEEFKGLDDRLRKEIQAAVLARKETFVREFRQASLINHNSSNNDDDDDDGPAPSSQGEDFSQLQEVMAAMLDIVGPDVDQAEIIRCIRAADFDLNRAINYFWGA